LCARVFFWRISAGDRKKIEKKRKKKKEKKGKEKGGHGGR
jgi:hypothetical protein